MATARTNGGEWLVFQADGKSVDAFPQDEVKEEVAVNIAKYPVENGAPMVDHAQQDHKEMSFSGMLVGDDLWNAGSKYIQLMQWAQNGTLVKIRGIWTLDNMLISNVTKSRKDAKMNAFDFSLTMTEVRLPSSSWSKRQDLGVQKPPQPPGQYVTVVAGNTYWGWWMQYGTPIQTLRDWNHWPDRFIPIGARARVK